MAERLMEARRAEARASRERPTQWRGPRAIDKGRGQMLKGWPMQRRRAEAYTRRRAVRLKERREAVGL